MVSKRKYTDLIPTFLVATSLILSACQESAQSVTARVAPAPSAEDSLKVTGRTTLSKELLAYQIDPVTLPAYGSMLAAQMNILSADSGFSWQSLYRLKTWMILPTEALNGLSLKIISSSSANATNGENGNIARQTQYEVWIKHEVFSKMNDADQAEVILSEYLIGLYSLKKIKDEDVCKLVHELYGKPCGPKEDSKDEVENTAIIDSEELAGAVSPRTGGPSGLTSSSVITDEELKKIHEVKDYMIEKGLAIKASELLEKMNAAGFRMDILVPELLPANDIPKSNETIEKETIAKSEVDFVFDQLLALKGQTLNCYSVVLGTNTPCSVVADLLEIKVVGTEIIKSFLSVEAKQGEATLVKAKVHKLAKMPEVFDIVDGTTKEKISLWQLTSEALEKKEEGATYSAYFLIVEKSEEGYSVLGFLSVPGKVNSLTLEPNSDRVVGCSGVRPEAKDAKTDIQLVASSDKHLAFIEANIGKFGTPYAPCY